jgi:hypothetical protein
MQQDIEKMATLERELERRFEKMCEKNGWPATAYLKIGGKEATIMLDKLSEAQITIDDVDSMRSLVSDFIVSELGIQTVDGDRVFTEDKETIPHTRALYHFTLTAHVDASSWLKAVA